MWEISVEQVTDSLEAKTQHNVMSAVLPLIMSYCSYRIYKLKQLNENFAAYTLFVNKKSANQNTLAQIYYRKCGFAAVYTMECAKGYSIGQS